MMTRAARAAVPFALFAILAQFASAKAPSSADPQDADEAFRQRIANAIVAARSKVHSLRLKVERHDANAAHFRPAGTEVFAFKDGMRFLEVTRILADRTQTRESVQVVDGVQKVVEEQFAVADETKRSVRVFDGHEMLMRGDGNVAQLESPVTRNIIRGSRFESLYLSTIRWYLRDPLAPDGFEEQRQKRSLPDAFIEGRYRISRELLDGLATVTMDGEFRALPPAPGLPAFEGSERCWLDETRAFMMVRSQVWNRATRKLETEISAADPVELVTGFWLPRTTTMTNYALPNGKHARTTLKVVGWEVNAVPDEAFAVEVPPNAMVIDFAETARRGLSEKNPLIRYSSGEGELMDRPLKYVFAERRKRWRWFFFVTVATAIATMAVGWRFQRRAGCRSTNLPGRSITRPGP